MYVDRARKQSRRQIAATKVDISDSYIYTLSEAWSGVNWADLMAAQGAFGTDFYDRSTRTIVGTMLWTEYLSYKSVPNAPWSAMRSAQFTAPSLGQSIGQRAVLVY